jgi:phosphatidylserine/phosphatidylglycerophosphate/cardiolipin synthase-like enzyme
MQFIRSDELNRELLRIVEEETDELFLISPYINLSTRFNNALVQVSKRNTKVTIISRWEKKFKPSDKELFDALVGKGFDLYLVERLHAKLYFTKAKGILS